MNSTLNTNRNN